ncbi:MAG: PD40 domain-containing protein [Myxococcales bacterium]|nr:PD40 domain-containing protein [Myxococcales bacterium]
MLAGLLLALLVLLAPRCARAADPTQIWYTLTTPHFYVHYYKNIRHDLSKVAQKVARVCEQVHRVLTPIMRYTPSLRTHIVVTDDTDGANGSAQNIPFNVIRAYVTGPAALSSLNDYDDWFYGLIMHEYVHILHIDTLYGLPQIVNWVLGKTWTPNRLQPGWFIEGIATFHESERTSGGRVRGTIFDQLLRGAVLDKRQLTLSQITSNTRYYPRGVVRYLYGSRFLKYIADRYGEKVLADISHIYGAQVIPYALNRVVKRVTGKTYEQLYKDFSAHLVKRYTMQVAAAKKRGLTKSSRLTAQGNELSQPRFSYDGRELVYFTSDAHRHSAYVIIDPATGKTRQRMWAFGGTGVVLTPDRRHVVHSQAESWRTFFSYHDIYVRDRVGHGRRRLTFGLRARDPDVSPDGRRVVFVMNELGTNHIAVIPFRGGKHRVVLRGVKEQQFSMPRFSPDGKKIVYSAWLERGMRDIFVLDLESGKQRRLTHDRALDLDPMFSPDGKRVYFSSDRTGIFNIYCLALDSGRLFQVTNVVGGALTPAVSPDEKTLFYAGFTGRGYDLHRMPLVRERFLPALPYLRERPKPPKLTSPDSVRYPVKRYNPLWTFFPRNYSASIGTDSYGTVLGISVAGGDVVGRHAYQLTFNIGTSKGNPSYSVIYAYNRFWPSIRFDTSRTEGPRGGLTLDGQRINYTEEAYGAGASIGMPALRIPDHNVSVSTGYRFNWYRNKDHADVLVEPGDVSPQLPSVGKLSGLTFNIDYGNTLRYIWGVSNAQGRSLSFALRLNLEALGSDFRSIQALWSWAEFWQMPWHKDHTLALRYGGGIGSGDSSRRGLFFIGGFPEQNIIQAVIDLAPLGGNYLRGYAPGEFFGEQYHLWNLEYRFPLFNIERGPSTLPIYFNYVHMSVFVDVGHAFFDKFEPKVGVGAELLLEWYLAYDQPFTLRVGYARGLMAEGGNEIHALIGNRF